MSRNPMTARRLGSVALMSVLLGGVAACGSGGGGGGNGVNPPPPAVVGVARFGAGFARLFNAAANSDPGNPVASDVIPVSLTQDPLPIP